ncbi:MAG: hypothetical protein ACRDRN_20625 [Sciscionella sp.]
MTLPADIALVTLTGTWLDGTGQPVNSDPTIGPRSHLTISPMVPTRFVDIVSNTAIMPQRQQVYLDGTGSVPAATQVIAVDAAALAGISGFQYAVAILLWDHAGAQLAPYSVIVSPTTGSSPFDLTTPYLAAIGQSVGVPAM